MNSFRKIPSLKMDDFEKELMSRWKTKGFYINNRDIHDTFKFNTTRFDYYTLGVCTSGYAKVVINGEELYYDKDSFALLLPNTVSKVLEVSNDYAAMSVYFEKEFLWTDSNNYQLERYNLLNQNGVPYIKMARQETDLIIEYIERLRSKMEDLNHLFRDSIIRNQIMSLINELEHMYLSKYIGDHKLCPQIGKEKLLSDFKNLLQKCFIKEHYTTFYADSLNISTKYLNELLKEATGKTTKTLINEALLTEAKILLRTGRFNVSEVASMLEYNNLEVFSRFFKKNSGMSPLRFKNT